MKEFVITTESNSDLAPEFIRQNGISVIPHYYTVGDEMYGGDRELSIREFYDEMRAGKKVGTTASNPAVIQEIFSGLAEAGKDILHISFSSALSAGYENVCMVASQIMEDYPGTNIIVLDTLSASVGEALLIIKALELKGAGKSLEETAAALKELVPHLCVQFTVENLDYLYRGGRLSRTSAVLGTVISLKPILYVTEEGKLASLSNVRGRKKSIRTLVDNMEARIGSYRDKQIAVGIMHGDCEEEANLLKQEVEDRFGLHDFLVRPIGPSIGAHSGPGTLGLVFLGDHK